MGVNPARTAWLAGAMNFRIQLKTLGTVFISTFRATVMAAALESQAYEELVDFIAGGTTPEAVMRFEPSAATRDRVAGLVEREKAVGLTSDEARELDHYLSLEHLMRLVKAKARCRTIR